MPKTPRIKVSKTLVHPNSRKAYQIAKSTTTEGKKLRRTKDRATKFDANHSKLLWFKEQCNPGKETFTNEDVLGLIEKYLKRYEDEMDQIDIVQGIPHRRKNQHASRKYAIQVKVDHERMLLHSSGFEAPDLLDIKALRYFRSWDGDENAIPNISLRKYTVKKQTANG